MFHEHATVSRRLARPNVETPVTEADYWPRLEFRVCRELAGMEESALRFLWCDGFIPEQYLLDDPTPRITGRAWICNGPKQEQWEFTLVFPEAVQTVQDISWAALLPSEEATGWLGVDRDGRQIVIVPRKEMRL